MSDIVKQESKVPALAPTPAALGNLDSSDVTLPRLYKGEFQSTLVQTDVVPKGSIFVAVNADDNEPQVIAKKAGEPVLVHILKAWKGKSANIDDAGNVVKSGGTFTTYPFSGPNKDGDVAPDGAYTDYHYIVVLPDVDPDVPVKLTLSKTSAPTGKKINFLLLKDTSVAPHNYAFELNTKLREGGSGGEKFFWYVWEARLVEADQDNVAAADALAEMVNSAPVPPRSIEASTGNRPAI